MGTNIGRDQVGGSSYEMSGDFQRATVTITSNYFNAGTNPQVHDEGHFQTALFRYLKWVEKSYGRLTLRGLKEREAGQLTLDLDEIYTSLEVEVNVETDERQRRRTRRPRPDADDPVANAHLQTIDMAQLLALDDRLVITGGPGSGKTTYLHLIASSVARALVTGDSRPVERALGLIDPLPLPVLISLAGYNRYRREGRGTLIDYISHAIIEKNGAIGLPDDFFKRLLMQGRGCFVLLDGLDEVARDDERGIVRDKVQSFANNDGIGRLVVTSRTRAYQGQAVFPYRLAVVRPMTPEQVAVLAGKWCDAAYQPDEATRQKVSLRREIVQLEELRADRNQPRLVDTPLLVTIVAVVHDNLNTLPRERAELYEECVKALLSEHYKAPSEEQSALVERGGKFNEKRNVLAQLAFEMMGTRSADKALPTAREEQVITWVRPLVVRMRGESKADEWLADFTEAMRERGSLLDERDGEYRFTHLTFQEFLAATYLGDTVSEADDIVSQLTQRGRVADAWWRETVLLTVGYIGLRSPDRALRLLNRLVAFALPIEGNSDVALSAAELAGTSFLELGSHDEETCKIIAARLKALLTHPHLTATNQLRGLAGLALGRLGDPREDVLAPVPITVEIPAGEFIMGSKQGNGPGEDPLAYKDEEPRHTGRIDHPYRIGKYPVTVAQFRLFIDGKGYEMEKYWTTEGWARREQEGWTTPRFWDDPTWNVDNHPVVGVSWYEAVAYCKWLTATNRDGHFFRLPDEAMWEKAARGTDGRRWPWGNDWDPAKLNAEQSIGRTSAVGVFPAGQSPYGVYDCAGNVLEWCSGPGYSSGASYPFEPRTYREDLGLRAVSRALRGGAWFRVVELLSDPDS